MSGARNGNGLVWDDAGTGSRAFKAGLFGDTGSGKTTTGALLALMTAKRLKKSVAYMVDSEGGADYIASLFAPHAITLKTIRTREFGTLVKVVEGLHDQDDVLLVDSISHFSDDVTKAYLAAVRRPRLRIQDFAVVYETWRQFSQPFVTSALNIIVCGRMSNVYENVTDDQTGELEFYKADTKMKAADKFGHEPDFLLEMTQEANADGRERLKRATTKAARAKIAAELGRLSLVNIVATVKKDRTRLLMGQRFTFVPSNDDAKMAKAVEAAFTPVLRWHLKNTEQAGLTETGSTREMLTPQGNEFAWQETKRRRDVALDEIKSTLQFHFPSATSPKDKQAIIGVQEAVFGVKSWTAIEQTVPLETLEEAVRLVVEGTPSRLEQACLQRKETMDANGTKAKAGVSPEGAA